MHLCQRERERKEREREREREITVHLSYHQYLPCCAQKSTRWVERKLRNALVVFFEALDGRLTAQEKEREGWGG